MSTDTRRSEIPMLDHKKYNVLIEFVHRHLDFHRSELESVLSMSNIIIGRDCLEVDLPKNVQHKIEKKEQLKLNRGKSDNGNDDNSNGKSGDNDKNNDSFCAKYNVFHHILYE